MATGHTTIVRIEITLTEREDGRIASYIPGIPEASGWRGEENMEVMYSVLRSLADNFYDDMNIWAYISENKESVGGIEEKIIAVVKDILDNGNFVVETVNESVLVKLMEIRGMPIKVSKSLRDIDSDYANWLNENNQK